MLVKQPNGTYKYESKPKEVPVKESVLAIPAAGMNLALDTTNPGNFFYRIRNAEGVEQNRIEYSVAGAGNVTRTLDRNAELQMTLKSKDIDAGGEIEVSIRAPYAGRVVRLKANAFESVAQGQPIMEVVSGGPLRVSIHVPTSWLPRLKVGTPVRVQFAEAGNRALTARVARLNGRVDGVSQSIEIQAMLDGAPGALLPGMIGQASFPSLPR